jgi:hypothetical protein
MTATKVAKSVVAPQFRTNTRAILLPSGEGSSFTVSSAQMIDAQLHPDRQSQSAASITAPPTTIFNARFRARKGGLLGCPPSIFVRASLRPCSS